MSMPMVGKHNATGDRRHPWATRSYTWGDHPSLRGIRGLLMRNERCWIAARERDRRELVTRRHVREALAAQLAGRMAEREEIDEFASDTWANLHALFAGAERTAISRAVECFHASANGLGIIDKPYVDVWAIGDHEDAPDYWVLVVEGASQSPGVHVKPVNSILMQVSLDEYAATRAGLREFVDDILTAAWRVQDATERGEA